MDISGSVSETIERRYIEPSLHSIIRKEPRRRNNGTIKSYSVICGILPDTAQYRKTVPTSASAGIVRSP